MKIFFTIAFLFSAIGAMACECHIMTPLKSKDDLKKYEFVALITVESIGKANTSQDREDQDITISIKELFKGSAITTINVANFYSPCQSGHLKGGEQLLVFGYINNGKLKTNDCSYYRIAGEEQSNFSGTQYLKSLRGIYQHDTIKEYHKR